jgi:DNA-binding CsgD family transcriptional regulator
MVLSPDDYRKVLNAIEILGRNLDWSTFPRSAVEAVAAVIDVDFISYNEVDPGSGSSRFLLMPDVGSMRPDSPEYAAFIRRFGNHPIVAHHASRASAGAVTRPFMSRLRLLGIVGNCCGQAELRLNLGLILASAPARLVGIAINRSLRDFDDRDAERLEALKPHLIAAFRQAWRFAERDQPPADNRPIAVAPFEPDLTRRESEVLYWVSMGKTNDEVGSILGARPATVKKHLEHIYDKLGVPNRTAAARMLQARQPPGAAAVS